MARSLIVLLATASIGALPAAAAWGAEEAPFRVLFSNDTTNMTRGEPLVLSFVDLAVR